MRIGIVTQAFPPARGGVAQHALHTALALQRRGHEVTVITTNFSESGPVDGAMGLDVRRVGRNFLIPANGASVNLTLGFGLKNRLRAIERECKFDVVHIHSPLEPILPFLAMDAIEAPKVGTFHSYVSGDVWPYQVLSSFVRKRFQKLAARIAVSEAARSFITRYFPGEFEIIPNGVDTKRFSADVEPMPGVKQPGSFTVLFVGRLDKRKGLRHLLLAMPHLWNRAPEVRLVVVGGGVLEAHYKGLLPPDYHDRVEFKGFVSAQDLPRYFAAADVFCAPATNGESFGIVLIEGLAAGKPVIASNITGYNSIIENEKTGLLVPPRDSRALADAIVRLRDDPALRDRLAKDGRAKAMEYDWERVTDRLEAVYKQVTENK